MTKLIAMLVLAGVQTGCFWVTTKHEGNKLREDVKLVEERLGNQEDILGDKVKKLKAVLEEATTLLARNSADLGADVSSLVQENAKLTGLVLEAKRYADEVKKELAVSRATTDERLAGLESRIAGLEQQLAKVPRKSPDEQYNEAKAAFEAGKYAEASAMFRALVAEHGSHSRAPEAQYYRAESLSRQKDYKVALGEFQKVFEKYPRASVADDALFRAGETAEHLKWCTDARAYYGLLRQKYPKSSFAKKARDKDKTLKKNARDKKKCQS